MFSVSLLTQSTFVLELLRWKQFWVCSSLARISQNYEMRQDCACSLLRWFESVGDKHWIGKSQKNAWWTTTKSYDDHDDSSYDSCFIFSLFSNALEHEFKVFLCAIFFNLTKVTCFFRIPWASQLQEFLSSCKKNGNEKYWTLDQFLYFRFCYIRFFAKYFLIYFVRMTKPDFVEE